MVLVSFFNANGRSMMGWDERAVSELIEAIGGLAVKAHGRAIHASGFAGKLPYKVKIHRLWQVDE
jgi:hypothetical protein